ncbi:MAG: hypothetical protein JNK82_12920 [Myxococcaceae bacterium]|nr:hypothetical protein [Myxococcaceae bacterium]
MQPTDTPDGALVYADWLLGQGNVQGELISVQVARQSPSRSGPAQRALRLKEEQLLARHGPELVGEVPPETELCWRGGFVRELAVRLSVDGLSADALLSRPVFALVERVELQLHGAGIEAPIATLAKLPRLRALKVTTYEALTLDVAPLKGLRRLEVDGRAEVKLAALPELEHLALQVDDVEGLSPREQPKLWRVVTNDAGRFEAFEGLELHLQDGAGGDVTRARRAVITLEEKGELPPGRVVSRTSAQNGERAFLLFEPQPAGLNKALDRLRQLPLSGVITAAHTTFTLGGHALTALELRSNEPQPSLLKLLATDLAATSVRGVLEGADSLSSNEALYRGHERAGSSVTSWVIDKKNLRRAVHRLFAFDPGLRAFDDVLLALDGAEPRSLRGPLPSESPQLPCCSPLEADLDEPQLDEEYDDDDDGGEYEDAHAGPIELVDRADPQPDGDGFVDVAAALAGGEEVEEDPEPDDDPDEPHRDAADADIEELLTQSPVDFDEREDGLEPDTEHGLDVEPNVDALAAPKACDACRSNAATESCTLCAADICEACVAVEVPLICGECRHPNASRSVWR